MRVSRVAPSLIGAVLVLSMAACSKPDAVRPVRAAIAPLPAGGSGIGGAEKLQRLNIMLMVTSLRCRRTGDDFTSDYRRFTARQATALSQAGAQLRGRLVDRHGDRAGKAAFERLGTSMANGYGMGHPWLNCRQLGQVARNLAKVEGRATLEEAADQLLSRRASPRMAWMTR